MSFPLFYNNLPDKSDTHRGIVMFYIISCKFHATTCVKYNYLIFLIFFIVRTVASVKNIVTEFFIKSLLTQKKHINQDIAYTKITVKILDTFSIIYTVK